MKMITLHQSDGALVIHDVNPDCIADVISIAGCNTMIVKVDGGHFTVVETRDQILKMLGSLTDQ